MARTYYDTINGGVVGEHTGGARTEYVADVLGSVVATHNAGAMIVNSYRYKPYGTQLSKNGLGTDPKFQFAGNSGSRQTGLSYGDAYNRARHLDYRSSR